MASYEKHAFGLYLVELKPTKSAIGICGLLKRDEFTLPDLGFAFLAQYCGQCYALEAVNLLLSVKCRNIL
ncbi:GNAT family N-acetyltransferase [Colwellia piezophila]|uniref:GNAT family N-acetyltransferase n=1 Tax=Colwellia piezophila TaxID=211668 RepID=UPI0003A36907|nr:GNAT family N-acetyltransferase [Colwellia piezophila]